MVNFFILVFWCIDKIFFILCYWCNCGYIVRREVFGDNEYVIMYVKLDSDVKYVVGDVYYFFYIRKENIGMLL